MNLVGDPILADEAFELGLVNRLVEDHELLDTALPWARKLAGQAPLAVAQIKRVSGAGDLDEGIEAEKRAFADGVRERRRQGGHLGVPRQTRAALPGKLSAVARGRCCGRGDRAGRRLARRASGAAGDRAPGRARARGALGRRADRRGHLGALGHPRLPLAGNRAVGEGRPDGGRPHRRLPQRPRALLALLRRALRHARRQAAQRRPPRARGDGAARPARRRDHPERRHAPPQGRHARAGRGARQHRHLLLPGVRRERRRSSRRARAWPPTSRRRAALRGAAAGR